MANHDIFFDGEKEHTDQLIKDTIVQHPLKLDDVNLAVYAAGQLADQGMSVMDLLLFVRQNHPHFSNVDVASWIRESRFDDSP